MKGPRLVTWHEQAFDLNEAAHEELAQQPVGLSGIDERQHLVLVRQHDLPETGVHLGVAFADAHQAGVVGHEWRPEFDGQFAVGHAEIIRDHRGLVRRELRVRDHAHGDPGLPERVVGREPFAQAGGRRCAAHPGQQIVPELLLSLAVAAHVPAEPVVHQGVRGQHDFSRLIPVQGLVA